MGGVAIGATRDLFGEAEMIVFPVITIHIGADGNIEDIIACHHLFIGVTREAYLGMEVSIFKGVGIPKGLDFVEVVTVVAGGRISIPGHDRPAVD
jgi:hypothetical protein